jgi:hypothetical protein
LDMFVSNISKHIGPGTFKHIGPGTFKNK